MARPSVTFEPTDQIHRDFNGAVHTQSSQNQIEKFAFQICKLFVFLNPSIVLPPLKESRLLLFAFAPRV